MSPVKAPNQEEQRVVHLYQPSVTVIVPVYNGERFLAEALVSILQQDYPVLELLVVDDGSTDQSAAIAATFPTVGLLRKPHSGIAPTLNYGLRHATGELLAFLDADDRWLPGKLGRQLAELEQQPALDMVFGHMRQFMVRETATGCEEIALPPQPAPHKSTLLIRRTALMRVGEFAEQEDRHDFLDWYSRATTCGLQMTIMADVLAERRIHDNNTGRRSTPVQRQQYLSTLRAVVNLRRQPALPASHGS